MSRDAERKFIRSFMTKTRWERAELEAGSAKKRNDFLWRMHWDIRPEYKHPLKGVAQAEDILKRLPQTGENVCVMALHSDMDGKILPEEDAVRQVYEDGLIATVYLPDSDIAFAYDEFHECWLIHK